MSDFDVIDLKSTESKPDSIEPAETRSMNLSCFEMWLDGIKATKSCMDPVSDAIGCFAGTLCCIAVAAANAEDDKNRPATRYDVVHAKQIRRNEAAEANAAYGIGLCLGDAAVDAVSVVAGIFIGGARASFFACTGNNNRDNSVFGYTREEIQHVNLFDSCTQPACCN